MTVIGTPTRSPRRSSLRAAERPRQRGVRVGASDIESPGDPRGDRAAKPRAVTLVERFDVRLDHVALVQGDVRRIRPPRPL
ncbi:MAG TPA: hypothetical protein VIG93_05755 [Gaiellaceae bacterium]